MSTDQLMNALIVPSQGADFVPGQYKKPSPNDDQLLIKVVSVGVNPVDWLMQSYGLFISEYPIVLGCDVAGVVESIGKSVTRFKVGDNVFAYTGLGRPGRGTFAEFCVSQEKQTWHRPDTLTPQEAATFPVGLLTAALGIYDKLSVELLPKTYSGEPFLVWGGASGVGLFAIQLAKLSGFHVLAVASEKNFDLLRSFGASEVFDYRDNTVVEKIKSAAGGKLRHALDCASPESTQKCASILASDGPAYLAFTTPGFSADSAPSHVKATMVDLGVAPESPSGAQFLERLHEVFHPYISSGQLKPLPIWQFPDGWQGIIDGLKASKEKRVSGQKVVVNVV